MHLKAILLCLILVNLTDDTRLNAQWVQIKGLPGKHVGPLFAAGSALLAATDSGLFHSMDVGVNWEASGNGLPGQPVTSLAANDIALFAGTPVGLFRSTDAGAHWNSVGHGIDGWPGAISISSIATLGNKLIAWADLSGLYYSGDNGESWIPAKNGPAYYSLTSVAACGGIALAGSEEGSLVYRSIDSGATWTRIGLPGLSDEVVNVAAFETVHFLARGAAGLFRSTDNGVTWVPSATGLPGGPGGPPSRAYNPMKAFAGDGTTIFAASIDGVFVSTDRGDTWANAYQNFGFVVNSLAIVGSTVFAGTEGGGVWQRPLSEIVSTVAQRLEAAPLSFALMQNYPNPFNPVTVINYAIGGTRGEGIGVNDVSLIVYDVLGKEIAVLVNEKKQPGNYSVRFDGSGLASGAYFYRLTAGNFVDTKQLMLVK